MIRKFSTIAAAAILAVVPLAASAQITPGTQLIGTMDQNLSSQTAQVGQSFTMSGVHSQNYNINGATIYGHVSSVQRASQGRAGQIALEVDKINTRSGNVYQAVGYVANAQVTTKSNATKEIGAAAVGALVGDIIGHTKGALLGGAGGYLYAKNNRQNVSIAQGSKITVQISSSRRQASHH
ncbi:MAG: hypothetical protein M3Y21_07095 [Candidatus Eremiobacteraeota bacterium]|nr:hypothetical protein [Candidatus Eremiobacteraeota bacterium]